MSLKGRYVSISGSASMDADRGELARCHAAVRELAKFIVRGGGRFVEYVTKDDRLDEEDPASGRLFFWTVAEALHDSLASGELERGTPVMRALHNPDRLHDIIPDQRDELWQSLVDAGVIELVPTDPQAHTGGEVRQLQVEHADAFVLIGGGKGVYHLGKLATAEDIPLVTLDVGIGAFYKDGEGSRHHWRAALENPDAYLPGAGDALKRSAASLSLRGPRTNPTRVAETAVMLLAAADYAKRKPRDLQGIILVVVPVELAAAFKVLGIDQDLRPHLTDRGTRLYAVRDGLHVAAVGAPGNPRAANVASELLGVFDPELMILTGIAGGDEGQTELGMVVIADQVHAYEPGAITGGDEPHVTPRREVYPMGHRDRQLLTHYFAGEPAKSAANRLWEARSIPLKSAPIATGEKLIRSKEFMAEQREHHEKLRAVEMEAQGFALACESARTPGFIVRGISDYADPDKHDGPQPLAAENAVAVALDLAEFVFAMS